MPQYTVLYRSVLNIGLSDFHEFLCHKLPVAYNKLV